MRSLIARPRTYSGDSDFQAGNSLGSEEKPEEPITGPPTFPTLPWELFVEILSFLDKKSLCALRRLDTTWRDLVDQDAIWKDLMVRQYGIGGQLDRAKFPIWKDRFMDADRLRWSFERKSTKIELWNGGRTAKDACKGDEKFRWVTVLSDNVFAAGQHYIEIFVDQLCDNNKNTIKVGFGLLDKCTTLTHNCPFGYSHGNYTSQDHNSWVYLADGRIMAQNKDTNQKGAQWMKNDRIGVLMDFFAQKVSFYHNSRLQAVPFPMACTNLHVAVSLIGGNQVTFTNSSIKTILQ